MVKINTNFRVKIIIERIIEDGDSIEAFVLGKLVSTVKNLKKGISDLVNTAQKYVREEIEQNEDPKTLGTIMTS